jgi:hypothetical protein
VGFRAVIGQRRACLHVPRRGGTTFKPGGGGAGALLEEAAALQLRGVGAAASEAEAAVVALAAAPAPRPGKAVGSDATEGPMEVAAGGGCGAGPPLLLSDSEQQCYSELFARCAGAASGGPGPGPPEATRVAPGTATAAAGPVADLFRASQLPPETLHQVCLCALLSLSGLWGQCLWEEWGNNDYSQGLFPEIWRAVARTAKKKKKKKKKKRGVLSCRGWRRRPCPQGHQPPLQLICS